MGLFQTNTTEGVDNYNQYVKPRLNQQQTNRQVGGQLRGLQSTTRRQGSTLRRTNQYLQGTAAPQYYRNYGGYYPGLKR